YDRSPDLQKKFGDPSSKEFARYVDTEAILSIRELQEVGIPFPPWEEMLTVCGETDLTKFLACGYSCFDSVRPYLDLSGGKRVLDFGVGCARTMRFFFRESLGAECYGCDVDSKAIAYLEDSVPFINALVSGNKPPLPYGNEFFDYIYSISVF